MYFTNIHDEYFSFYVYYQGFISTTTKTNSIMEQIELVKDAALVLESQIAKWEPILAQFDDQKITFSRNSQNRNIKQIVGHMIDSCVNNHHRIVRLQYLKRLSFPDY